MENLKAFIVSSGKFLYKILSKEGVELHGTKEDLLALSLIQEIVENPYFCSTLKDNQIMDLVRITRRIINDNPNIKSKEVVISDTWGDDIKIFPEYTFEYDYQWVGDPNSIFKLRLSDGSVTGMVEYKDLIRVRNSPDRKSLDAFNFDISLSDLPQDKKPNLQADPDYVNPEYDPLLAPSEILHSSITSINASCELDSYVLNIESTLGGQPSKFSIVSKPSWVEVIGEVSNNLTLAILPNKDYITLRVYDYKWITKESELYCKQVNGDNTGYMSYPNLYKVSDDAFQIPLDINNNNISRSNLPQHIKLNEQGTPGEVQDILNVVACPLPIVPPVPVLKVLPSPVAFNCSGGTLFVDVISTIGADVVDFTVVDKSPWFTIVKGEDYLKITVDSNMEEVGPSPLIFESSIAGFNFDCTGGTIDSLITSSIEGVTSDWEIISTSSWITAVKDNNTLTASVGVNFEVVEDYVFSTTTPNVEVPCGLSNKFIHVLSRKNNDDQNYEVVETSSWISVYSIDEDGVTISVQENNN